MYWHPHNYEILSCELVMPGLPQTAEKAAIEGKINSYGKTWHFCRAHCNHRLDEQPDAFSSRSRGAASGHPTSHA